jgi:uncharacterized cupin superfamily protein
MMPVEIDRMDEARLDETPEGLVPATAGWFVVNVADAAWHGNARFGEACVFENRSAPETRFAQLGINVHVLQPGQPACMYHRENLQEDFLVLSGECLVVIEGRERRLRAWDFVHCPPGTNHVFVGAGSGPCAILMVGARSPDEQLVYPVDATAGRHAASVPVETPDPQVAYSGIERSTRRRPSRWPL